MVYCNTVRSPQPLKLTHDWFKTLLIVTSDISNFMSIIDPLYPFYNEKWLYDRGSLSWEDNLVHVA